MSEDKPPFNKGYVCKLTTNNMRKAVDVSINRTSSRLKEFDPGTDKWQEVLDTIHILDKLKSLVDDFVINNKAIFTKDKQ